MGPNGAYIPFGGGQRNCVGTFFAWMEAVIVLATVLQHWELQPAAAGAPFPRPQPLLTLRPEEVRLKLVRRRAP
jgi:cytochrome P450